MMRAKILLLGAGALFVLAAGVARGEARTTGTVVETSALLNTVTVVTHDGRRFTFDTGDRTTIRRDGQEADLGALSAGTEVSIESPEEPRQGDEILATRIDLRSKTGTPEVAGPRATGEEGEAEE